MSTPPTTSLHSSTDLTQAAAQINTSQIDTITPTAQKKLVHRRTFCYEVYECADGLWEINAQMQDHKTEPLTIGEQHFAQGHPLHSMVLSLSVNDEFTIVAAQARTLSAPYGKVCQAITPDYQNMVGLSLIDKFRDKMRERFAYVAGCTHITELSFNLPTVAIQGIGSALAKRKRQSEPKDTVTTKPPFGLNQCHALSEKGEVIQTYFANWYRP